MHKKYYLIILIIAVIFIGFFIAKKGNNSQIKIGVILPLTGPSAVHGKDITNGIKMAYLEILQSLGPGAPKPKLLIEDDFSDPKHGVFAIKKIIGSEHPSIIIGPVASSIMLAMIPIVEKEKVVLLSPAASSPKISNSSRYVFRISLLASQQGEILAEYCKSKLKTNKAAILYLNDDTGIAYKNAFQKNFTSLGGTITFIDSYEKNNSDFRTQLVKIKIQNAGVIFIPGTPNSTGLILRQAKELGIDAKFIGNYGAEGQELLKIAGNAAEGFVFTSIPISKKFINDYSSKYNADPTIGSALGYDALHIAWNTICKYGDKPDSIQMGLMGLKNYIGASGTTNMLQSGDAEKECCLKIVREQKFEILQ